MYQKTDWWALQFIENAKDIAQSYNQFCINRQIDDFDKAYTLHEELNTAYEMSLNLIDFVKLGRGWLSKQDAPPRKLTATTNQIKLIHSKGCDTKPVKPSCDQARSIR